MGRVSAMWARRFRLARLEPLEQRTLLSVGTAPTAEKYLPLVYLPPQQELHVWGDYLTGPRGGDPWRSPRITFVRTPGN